MADVPDAASERESDLAVPAQAALAAAKKAGAKQCGINVVESRFFSVTFRDGAMDKSSASTQRELRLSLYIEGRYGRFSTEDLRPEALNAFVAQAAHMTKALDPDPARGLLDPSLYAALPGPDLGVFDPVLADDLSETFLARAGSLEAMVRGRAKERGITVLSAEGSAGYEAKRTFFLDSNGFTGLTRRTECDAGADVTVKDRFSPDKRRQDGWEVSSPILSSLEEGGPDQGIADKALSLALRQQGAKPAPSGKVRVLVENRAAVQLLSVLLGPLGGPALRRRASFLAGKKDRIVAAEIMNLRHDPLLKGGFNSYWFDGEGAAAKAMPLIEDGRLANYYLDAYHSRVLGLPRTTGSHGNLLLTPTTTDGFDGLLASLSKGLVVTGFLGGNSNAVTGDFSYGVRGLWVENGKVVHAVEGSNLSGNFLDVWTGLEGVGADPYPYSSVLAPCLVFARVEVGGV